MVVSPESALQKPDVYESIRIQLSSSILHIGSAVSRLNPFEYVQTAKKVYLPNQEALAKALQQSGGKFLNDYIQAIEERRDISNLLRNAFGTEWWNVTDADGEAIFPKNAIAQKLTDASVTDLRPMIRNGMGQLFIPGSSIKGAIRTAIAYYLLKYPERYGVHSTKRVSEIENTLRQRLGELREKFRQKFVDDNLFMNSFFSDFNLTYQDRVFSGNSQNTDFLRCLKVTDSEAIVESQMTTKKGTKIPINFPCVAEVIVSSKFANDLAKYRASLYVEMVRNVQTEVTLSLDKEMFSWFKHKEGMKIPFSTLHELVQICQEFSQEQWDYEHDYWQNIKNNSNASGRNLDFNSIREFYEPDKCPYSLRLGWGSGMNGTTVGLCLDDELREQIRDTCGIQAPGFEAPKSRRTVINLNGDIKFVPGWVKFKTL